MPSDVLVESAPADVRAKLAGRDLVFLVGGRHPGLFGLVGLYAGSVLLFGGLAVFGAFGDRPSLLADASAWSLAGATAFLLVALAWIVFGLRGILRPTWYAGTPQGLVILHGRAVEERAWHEFLPEARVSRRSSGRGDVSLLMVQTVRRRGGEEVHESVDLLHLRDPHAVARACMRFLGPYRMRHADWRAEAAVRRERYDTNAYRLPALRTLVACAGVAIFFACVLVIQSGALDRVGDGIVVRSTPGRPLDAVILALVFILPTTLGAVLSARDLVHAMRGSEALLLDAGVIVRWGRFTTYFAWSAFTDARIRGRSLHLPRRTSRAARTQQEDLVLTHLDDPDAAAAYAAVRIDPERFATLPPSSPG